MANLSYQRAVLGVDILEEALIPHLLESAIPSQHHTRRMRVAAHSPFAQRTATQNRRPSPWLVCLAAYLTKQRACIMGVKQSCAPYLRHSMRNGSSDWSTCTTNSHNTPHRRPTTPSGDCNERRAIHLPPAISPSARPRTWGCLFSCRTPSLGGRQESSPSSWPPCPPPAPRRSDSVA